MGPVLRYVIAFANRKTNRQNGNSKIPQITIQQRLLYGKQFLPKKFSASKKIRHCSGERVKRPEPACAAAKCTNSATNQSIDKQSFPKTVGHKPFVYKMLHKNNLCLVPPLCSKTLLLCRIKKFAHRAEHKKFAFTLFVSRYQWPFMVLTVSSGSPLFAPLELFPLGGL